MSLVEEGAQSKILELQAEHARLEWRLSKLQRGYNVRAEDEIREIKKRKLHVKDQISNLMRGVGHVSHLSDQKDDDTLSAA
jgi:uncharacterized protein YdcH (DUF465 family)